jgi:hypothetical protein
MSQRSLAGTQEISEPTLQKIPLFETHDEFMKKLKALKKSAKHRERLSVVSFMLPRVEETGGTLKLNLMNPVYTLKPDGDDLTFYVWDKNGLLDESAGTIEASFELPDKKVTYMQRTKQVSTKSKKKLSNPYVTSEYELVSNKVGNDVKLFVATPSVNPKCLFQKFDWIQIMDYWLKSGTQKDSRLINAFKGVVLPLPMEYNTAKWQWLNNHMIWNCNTGTGKSSFMDILGSCDSSETLNEAGLLGGNTPDYKGQYKGRLEGSGVYMIDEVSEQTYLGREGDVLMNKLLKYMEQGRATRDLKKVVECRGVKTLILNSNPVKGKDVFGGFIHFLNVIAGENTDRKRLGRRFGMLLFGDDFTTVSKDSGNIPDDVFFISSIIRDAMSLSKKTWYTLYSDNYKWLSRPDHERAQELEEMINPIHDELGKTEIIEFLMGMSMSTPKIKTSAFRSFLLDNLPLVYAGKQRELTKMWKVDRDEYIDTLHQINMASFRNMGSLRSLFRDSDSDDLKELIHKYNSDGYSQNKIARILGVTQPYVSKILNQEEVSP